jgi:tRNA(Ile)-lysidine synthase
MTSSFAPDDILSCIQIPDDARTIIVAFSGGVDSHVLLHLLYRCRHLIKQKIFAVHINHSLNKKAEEWANHCINICESIGIDCKIVKLDASAPKGQSPEAWARHKRYEALAEYLDDQDLLLTAHHKDDTAETLLLQLFRGAGPAGLAAMPSMTSFGNAWHGRPLLGYDRADLVDYANEQGLIWIEDDSNLDVKFDRNFLRNEVLPLIKMRWPGVSHTLARSALIQADTSELLSDIAMSDLPLCQIAATRALDTDILRNISRPRAANLIRYWIKKEGYNMPTSAQLQRIFQDIIYARDDAEPCVRWNDCEVYRYRNQMFVTSPLPSKSDIPVEISWDISQECSLPLGRLQALRESGQGIRLNASPDDTFKIRFRRGSESIRKGGHYHKLKNLFQEQGVPACFRGFIPLIYIDDELVSVAGLITSDDYIAAPQQEGIRVNWSYADRIFFQPRD